MICGGIIETRENENSLEIVSLARFTVDQHNAKQNSLLEFGKVVNTKQQLVAGIMYYITMEVTDGGAKKIYEAHVWVKKWEDFKEVQEFKLIGDA